MLFFYLLLLFTVLPLTEFALLVWLGGQIGLLATIALVLGTGVLGASLARQQGLATLWRIRQQSASGQMPTDALLDGALILVAGAVLITPGILTDAFGFSLLIPPLRALIKRGLKHWFAKTVQIQTQGFGVTSDKHSTNNPAARGDVIDVEVVETRVEDIS